MDREISEHVGQKIRAEWLKWRLFSGVLCDWHIQGKLKEKNFRTAIRPVMTYGA